MGNNVDGQMYNGQTIDMGAVNDWSSNLQSQVPQSHALRRNAVEADGGRMMSAPMQNRMTEGRTGVQPPQGGSGWQGYQDERSRLMDQIVSGGAGNPDRQSLIDRRDALVDPSSAAPRYDYTAGANAPGWTPESGVPDRRMTGQSFYAPRSAPPPRGAAPQQYGRGLDLSSALRNWGGGRRSR